MERYLKGDVVIISFPYSNLRQYKKRPALVLASLKGEDIILCQITSQFKNSQYAVSLEKRNFSDGSLPVDSNIHCSLIFTMSKNMIIKKVGTINMATMIRVFQAFGMLFSIGTMREGAI